MSHRRRSASPPSASYALPWPGSRRSTVSFLTLASLLVALAALGGCGSDEAAGGDDSGTNVDNDTGGDLSLDLPGIDAGGDAGGSDTGGPDEGGPDAGEDTGGGSTLGGDCFGNADCSPGEQCIGAGNGSRGYCTILNCRTSADCDFGDSDQVFCCSNYGPSARGCFVEEAGTVCGDESGLQGDSCEAGGQSDCDGSDAFCIELYGENLCAEFCEPDEEETGCPEGSWCYDTDSRGTGLCVPEGDREAGAPCADDPGACGAGMFCEGGFESPPDPRAFCAPLCESDRECDEDAGEWCRIFPGAPQGSCLPSGDLDEGESCTEDRWGCGPRTYCVNDGTRYAFCAGLCRTQAECDDGYYCNRFSASVGVCWPEGDPDVEPGDSCADEPWICGESGFCVGGWGNDYNPDAYCTLECDGDEDICGDDFACTEIDSGAYCFPDGDAEAGEACNGGRDCVVGTACVYDEGDRDGFCAPVCSTDAECEGDEWCTASPDDDEGGVCLPDGEAGQNDPCADDPAVCGRGTFCAGDPAICVADCTADEDSCAAGSVCSPAAEGAQRYCVPNGEIAVGEPCTRLYDCVAGALCIGIEEDLAGVCADTCESTSECATGSWCLRTPGLGYCIPGGVQRQGESCAGEANRFECAPGHICAYAGTEVAYCQAICSGFADSCAEGTVCRFSGGTLNLCAAVGDASPGDPCVEDPTVCGPESTCVEAGTEDAYCARICTFDGDACDDGSECVFSGSGVGLCTPTE